MMKTRFGRELLVCAIAAVPAAPPSNARREIISVSLYRPREWLLEIGRTVSSEIRSTTPWHRRHAPECFFVEFHAPARLIRDLDVPVLFHHQRLFKDVLVG